MSTHVRTITAALALSLAVVAAACGGDDGGDAGRPSVDELSVKFRNEIGTTPAQGRCMAEVLVASDVSDGAMADMVRKQLSQSELPFAEADLSDDDQEALTDVGDELNACIGVAPETTVPTGSTAPGPTDAGTATTVAGATDTTTGTTAVPGPGTDPATTDTAPETTVPPG